MTPAQQAEQITQQLQSFQPTRTYADPGAYNNMSNVVMGQSSPHMGAAATAGDPAIAAAMARMSPQARARGVPAYVGQNSQQAAQATMYPAVAGAAVAGAGEQLQRFGAQAGANNSVDRLRLRGLTGAQGALGGLSDLEARMRSLNTNRINMGVKTQGDVLNDRIKQAQQSVAYNTTQGQNMNGWQTGDYNWAGNQNSLPYWQNAQAGQALIPQLQQQLQSLGY
jgi:hypothetical protein